MEYPNRKKRRSSAPALNTTQLLQLHNVRAEGGRPRSIDRQSHGVTYHDGHEGGSCHVMNESHHAHPRVAERRPRLCAHEQVYTGDHESRRDRNCTQFTRGSMGGSAGIELVREQWSNHADANNDAELQSTRFSCRAHIAGCEARAGPTYRFQIPIPASTLIRAPMPRTHARVGPLCGAIAAGCRPSAIFVMSVPVLPQHRIPGPASQ